MPSDFELERTDLRELIPPRPPKYKHAAQASGGSAKRLRLPKHLEETPGAKNRSLAENRSLARRVGMGKHAAAPR